MERSKSSPRPHTETAPATPLRVMCLCEIVEQIPCLRLLCVCVSLSAYVAYVNEFTSVYVFVDALSSHAVVCTHTCTHPQKHRPLTLTCLKADEGLLALLHEPSPTVQAESREISWKGS